MICSVENVLGHHSYGLLLQQEIGVCVTEDTKRRRRHTLFSEEKSSIFRSITIASHKFSTITPQQKQPAALLLLQLQPPLEIYAK